MYVDLETTPFIARTDPLHALVLHTNEKFSNIDSVWMTQRGEFVFQLKDKVAMLDDRDLATTIEHLRIDNAVPSEEQLWADLAKFADNNRLSWNYQGNRHQVHRILHEQLAERFKFIKSPRST